MILQLLNQYVYKLEYIILGTTKDTSIKISIDDTFYDIRQKINNPDLVKIHKEDLKKYDFDMKYGRNNVLKDIIHSMYKNSYNCDIFLGIGGNDKKVHKYILIETTCTYMCIPQRLRYQVRSFLCFQIKVNV